ncbi:MAG: hypothetical protein M1832_004060 [Thelocarpon impressellum]|nr:MAG: hypothetical protein M1832_004060 [Thelocarpon impressellum]
MNLRRPTEEGASDCETVWHPSQILALPQDAPPYALIILNVPLEHAHLPNLIADSCYTVCADGGANRLRDAQLQGIVSPPEVWLPDAIVGDLDSLVAETRYHYEGRGVAVFEDSDQESTDLTKCINHITRRTDEILSGRRAKETSPASTTPSRLDLFIIGSMAGRLDQAFSTLNSLVAASSDHDGNRRTFLLTPGNIAFILGKGKNTIHTPLDLGILEVSVGIIPLAGSATITTEGLEYDVTAWPTGFGGRVSTSNHIQGPLVEVNTHGGDGLLFTIELAGAPREDSNETRSERD